jgi:hypothetical protein
MPWGIAASAAIGGIAQGAGGSAASAAQAAIAQQQFCLLYTSDAADEG